MHGYLSSGRSFYKQLDYFSRDFRTFAPDLKGFASNADMPYPYSLDDYVSDVKEYIYKQGIKNPYIVAHSFGGRIALRLASENFPLKKAVLTGSAGLKPPFSLKRQAKKTAYSLLKRFLPKEKLSAFFSADYRALSPVMRESFKKIVAEYQDGELRYITVPTLIINGLKDAETPPLTAKRLNRGIKNSRLIFIPNAGHFCFIDKPLTFNTEVKEFFISE